MIKKLITKLVGNNYYFVAKAKNGSMFLEGSVKITGYDYKEENSILDLATDKDYIWSMKLESIVEFGDRIIVETAGEKLIFSPQ